ncbi:Pro-Pol polyprotein [Nosema granulosis]|uniref:Pro-Pol polyprotein n=1 Tax=Nosema granulosis TaxID=83296 RepID=A0A9P6GX51_9MICR|nr:Pro-Pol polyprotein [Nosema granulosis]
MEAKNIITFFEIWCKEVGKPEVIITDNGEQFTSREIDRYYKDKNIRKLCVPVYYPALNGIVERVNQHISEILRICKYDVLEDITRKIEQRINNNYNTTLQFSPREIILKQFFMIRLMKDVIKKKERRKTVSQ